MFAVAGSTTMPSDLSANSVGLSSGSSLPNTSSACQATTRRCTNRSRAAGQQDPQAEVGLVPQPDEIRGQADVALEPAGYDGKGVFSHNAKAAARVRTAAWVRQAPRFACAGRVP